MVDKPQKPTCVCGSCFPSPAGSLCGGEKAVDPKPEESFKVDLNKKEKEALEELSKLKELSPENVIRQALRLYDLVNKNMMDGYSIRWVDRDGKERPKFLPKGCGWPGMD